MKLIKFDEFTNIINNLITYYKELNDLKEAGLDLSKFDAHKTLYSIVFKNLDEQFGLQASVEIMKYAENPKIGTIEDLWNCIQTYMIKQKPVDTKIPKDTNECNNQCKCDTSDKKVSKKNSKFIVDGEEVTEEDYRKVVKKTNDFLESLITEFFK